MKNFILILTLLPSLFMPLDLKAQDTLILNNGSEMYVKVIEVGENIISFKKNDNPQGPTYSKNISDIFMAVYKGGKRETFQATSNQTDSVQTKNLQDVSMNILSDKSFEVRLLETKSIPDKNKKGITVSATIDTYYQGGWFSQINVNFYQISNAQLDYTKVNYSYWKKSFITFSLNSESLKKILFQKYENEAGKGAWALPPDFFSLKSSLCSIAFLEQVNLMGSDFVIGGKLNSTILNLADCTSVEKKILSVALLWLQTNFEKKN